MTKYRITANECQNAFHVQTWDWWWPFWNTEGDVFFAGPLAYPVPRVFNSLAAARAFIEKEKMRRIPRHVVGEF